MIDLSSLNAAQREAVEATEGPLLVLAGAGSGKTRVLTSRIAHIIDDLGVSPYEILAITFTNKAAAEMRERLSRQLGMPIKGMWVSTFHALGVRMLRADGHLLGYTRNFTIYDDDDAKRLIKEIMREQDVDDKAYAINALRGRISSAKNQLVSVNEYESKAGTTVEKVTARIYSRYQQRLHAANAMDFDDLLTNTVRLLKENPAVLEGYQQRFRYIHIDEYQDTNHAQYVLVNMLAAKHKNLMVVGDDDQSIYSWRGADISNILEFERDYPDAKTVKLEQNYRSTGCILAAANAVVANNPTRKSKTLFTSSEHGEKIALYLGTNEHDEARYIAAEIDRVAKGSALSYRDCAVFYRTNAQSRVLEDAFLRAGIPYRIVGGTRFFDRAEIRDVMAYLKVVVNPADDISLKRVINTPRRGIGSTTVQNIEGIAYAENISFDEAIRRAILTGELRAPAQTALGRFIETIDAMRSLEGDLKDLVEMLIDKSGLLRALESERTDESMGRAENVREFVNVVAEFGENHDEPTLEAFMEWLALRTDLDSVTDSDDTVTMMTVHTAKGLEFPVVFVAGLEESIFPHMNSMHHEAGVEEERRLAYVAITRARKKLFLTHASTRHSFGTPQTNPRSRFIEEIPNELLEITGVGSLGFGGGGWEKRGDRRGVSDHGFGGEYGRAEGRVYGQGSSYRGGGDFGTEGVFTSKAKPSKPKSSETVWAAGDRIDHKTFGMGRVKEVNGDALTIVFDRGGIEKRLLVGYAPIVKIVENKNK